MFPGDESGAEGAHDPGDVRPYGLAAGHALETAQYGVVIKRSALHDDFFAEIFRVGQFDHLEQCVFNDGDRKTGRNVSDGRAFFLRLFYFGIHKNRTAGTEVDRMFCK